MMNCDRAYGLFSELADGTLDAGLRDKVEAHLNDCPACQHLFERFTDIYRVLPTVGEAPLPEDLRERIARQLDLADYERKTSKPKFGWLKFGLVGATAAAGVALYVLNRTPVTSGVEANPLGVNTNATRPLGVRVIENKVHLQLRPAEDTVVSVYQGGSDFTTMPPLDAKLLRTDKVTALSIYNVPLDLDSESAETVWVITSNPGERTRAIFLPSSKPASGEVLTANYIDALRAIAQRYKVVIAATLKEVGSSKSVDLRTGDAQAAIHSLGLNVTESGGVLNVTD